eukprot:7262618-Prymnesium_polylepis.2
MCIRDRRNLGADGHTCGDPNDNADRRRAFSAVRTPRRAASAFVPQCPSLARRPRFRGLCVERRRAHRAVGGPRVCRGRHHAAGLGCLRPSGGPSPAAHVGQCGAARRRNRALAAFRRLRRPPRREGRRASARNRSGDAAAGSRRRAPADGDLAGRRQRAGRGRFRHRRGQPDEQRARRRLPRSVVGPHHATHDRRRATRSVRGRRCEPAPHTRARTHADSMPVRLSPPLR